MKGVFHLKEVSGVERGLSFESSFSVDTGPLNWSLEVKAVLH